MSGIELAVRNMSCSSCAGAVTRVLQRHDRVAAVEVDLERSLARVQAVEGVPLALLASALVSALNEAGYPSSIVALVEQGHAGATVCGSKGWNRGH
ncbi:MAG TPA: heavy-metal-associated domain-containing protein [Albitalea sp.]